MVCLMIIVDYREPDIITNKIKNKKVKKLDVGDYIVGNLMIERKVPHDFLHYPSKSQNRNRFWRQLERMKNLDGYQPCIAIVDKHRKSSLNYIGKHNKTVGTKLKMFKIILLTYGIPIIQFRNNNEFIRFLEICDKDSG